MKKVITENEKIMKRLVKILGRERQEVSKMMEKKESLEYVIGVREVWIKKTEEAIKEVERDIMREGK